MAGELNLNLFKERFKQYLDNNFDNVKIDKKVFTEKICNDLSIFNQLDIDGDGEVSESEFSLACGMDADNDGIVTKDERRNLAMDHAKYFARRTVDKWFSIDINRDGYYSNVEDKFCDTRMCDDNDKSLLASKTNEELAKIYNMEETIDSNSSYLEEFLNGWAENIKNAIKEQYGVELSNADMILVKKEMIKQLNTWLFKTGDNATGDAPLYNSCNNTAYTRLMTPEEVVSCCGGNIDKPPMATQPVRNADGTVDATGCGKVFSAMEKECAVASANDMKNRLAWGMFDCKSDEVCADMTPEEWQEYKSSWEEVRNMKASDFRALLLPENKEKLEAFESKSIMTVKQIVAYIDIVEGITGQDFDSEDWSLTAEQFNEYGEKFNGTYGDETRLEGKTRADIPENRRALLRFLEEKGWLYEQFK